MWNNEDYAVFELISALLRLPHSLLTAQMTDPTSSLPTEWGLSHVPYRIACQVKNCDTPTAFVKRVCLITRAKARVIIVHTGIFIQGT